MITRQKKIKKIVALLTGFPSKPGGPTPHVTSWSKTVTPTDTSGVLSLSDPFLISAESVLFLVTTGTTVVSNIFGVTPTVVV